MFDRLIDLLIAFMHLFRFWEVVMEYQHGVRFRFGHVNKEFGPGIHYRHPFGIDLFLIDNVVPRVTKLDIQSITTEDGKRVSIRPIVRYRIDDLIMFLCNVEDADQSMGDAVSMFLESRAAGSDWNYVRSNKFRTDLQRYVRDQAKEWGIGVESLGFADRQEGRSYRLWQDTQFSLPLSMMSSGKF